MARLEGFLAKNHRGSSSLSQTRWFVSDGYHVTYAADNSPRSKLKGHFDLRNVVGIRKSAAVPGAV